MPGEVSAYLAQLVAHCASMSSVWRIGLPADRAPAPPPDEAPAWDLLAFVDQRALQQLRYAAHLHREGMRVRVVTDSDNVLSAWGEAQCFGSLSSWAWRRASVREAYYDESVWAEPVIDAMVRRFRRRAICLWEESYSPARRG